MIKNVIVNIEILKRTNFSIKIRKFVNSQT